ncbi:hypothetical protein, partial [Paraglaciecola hydrolytica]|uniref:hypothetical protein n=1 Tax=Paraglaciecola hydrolytica TaxID=1799789 RepID=UPI00138F2B1B
MFRFLDKPLSEKQILNIKEQAISAFDKDNYDVAINTLSTLVKAQASQKAVAIALVEIIDEGYFTIEDGINILKSI